MRHARLQLTIAGVMGIVAFAAVVLGCLKETDRIKRTQAFYLRESARYAQSERIENDKRSHFLETVLRSKRSIEKLQRTESAAEVRDHFFFPRQVSEPLDVSETLIYDLNVKMAKECSEHAEKARIDALQFAELSNRYREAGSCVWLPFGPDPLKLRDGNEPVRPE